MPRRGSSTNSLWDSTAEMDTRCYPGSGPSWRGKTPTSCLGCIALLAEVTVQGELRELEVANNGYRSLPLPKEPLSKNPPKRTPLLLKLTPSFYRCLGPLPPKLLAGRVSTWRRRRRRAAEGGPGSSSCEIKSDLGFHHRPVEPSREQPREIAIVATSSSSSSPCNL